MATSNGAYVGIDVSKDRLDVTMLGEKQEKQWSALRVRRKQLEDMLKVEQSRLRTSPASLKNSVQQILALLKEEKDRLEEQIEAFLKEHKAWQEQAPILSSAPGVGRVTTASLLADLPELAKMDRKKIVALVGVAPMNADSGKKRGYRKTKGGRRDVRSVFYMSPWWPGATIS